MNDCVSNSGTIDLTKRDLTRPIVLSNLRGTYDRPIIITCGKTISVNTFGCCPQKAANRIAELRQENGGYPSVGQVSDQAALALINCQFVIVKGIEFNECWPGTLDLNNCQNIVVLDCKFGASTIAIGANGIDTREIWIERCSFKQTKYRQLWDEIAWDQVHGSYEISDQGGVSETDHRHFDGDFFRAWDIAGNVTIRDCDIVDAFNGIHFFNSVDAMADDAKPSMARFNNGRRSASNVLIENNRFVRVRDNCIEPEDYAWNWVVRSNTFDTCYAPYSFELQRAGYFYIYDNHHWIDKPATIGERTGVSGFKLSGRQKNEGNIYIFNNSWLCKNDERLFRKKALGKMKHYNHAIKYNQLGIPRLFGNGWGVPTKKGQFPEIVKRKGFTTDWQTHQIEMDGDWITNDGPFDLELYRIAGYDLGSNTIDKDPGYSAATQRPNNVAGRKWLKPSDQMLSSGISWVMRLPGYDEAAKGKNNFEKKYEVSVPASGGAGAGMGETQLEFFKSNLRFVPDCPISPEILMGQLS